MAIYLTKQRKCATNLPISFVFNFWSRDMSHDHNQTLRHKKTSRFTSGEKFILLYVSWWEIFPMLRPHLWPQALNPLSRGIARNKPRRPASQWGCFLFYHRLDRLFYLWEQRLNMPQTIHMYASLTTARPFPCIIHPLQESRTRRWVQESNLPFS